MGSKATRTVYTTHIQGMVLAKSGDHQVKAIIRGLTNARTDDDIIYLGFAHRTHYEKAQNAIPALQDCLGFPVEVEYMAMLEEGFKLGGRIRSWDE